MRRHVSFIIAVILVGSVATACIVRTRPASQPVYVESHGKHKHKKAPKPHKQKHKKHH